MSFLHFCTDLQPDRPTLLDPFILDHSYPYHLTTDVKKCVLVFRLNRKWTQTDSDKRLILPIIQFTELSEADYISKTLTIGRPNHIRFLVYSGSSCYSNKYFASMTTPIRTVVHIVLVKRWITPSGGSCDTFEVLDH